MAFKSLETLTGSTALAEKAETRINTKVAKQRKNMARSPVFNCFAVLAKGTCRLFVTKVVNISGQV